ncbi:hypothetical protein AC579_9292 [Pseudocercospora musae]|uniref:Glycosyl hydrolase family 32 C-terminal domain-containing protein n=1 Tax=Pseudocercospora musae TaxID=113226 RepID=A0A139I581_9PEZI|nr:hypothetical protein AC579_9292 [Pseudocercospora musae]
MTIAYAAEFVIGVFTSPDLKEWTHASSFTKHGHLGVQYECPNLLQMPMRGQEEPVWLLVISINPGGPRGGSVSQYFVGDFNGTHFELFDDATRLTDFGKDNYAAQFFHGVPANEPQIALGWASNWQYTQLVPTGLLEHASLQLVARQRTIMTYFGDVESGAVYFEAKITNLTSSTRKGTANFTISSSLPGEYIQGGIKVAGEPGIWIDRGHVRGFDNTYFSDKFSEEGTFVPSNASWNMSVVVDRSMIEIFLDGAQAAGTLTFFPNAPLDTLAIYVGGIDATASSSVAVWGLKDTWAPQADVNATVAGNVTQVEMSYRKRSSERLM